MKAITIEDLQQTNRTISNIMRNLKTELAVATDENPKSVYEDYEKSENELEIMAKMQEFRVVKRSIREMRKKLEK